MTKSQSETSIWLKYYNQVLIEGAYLASCKLEKKTSLKDVKHIQTLIEAFSEEQKEYIKSEVSKNGENKFVMLPLRYTTPSGEKFPFSIPFSVEKMADGSITIIPPEKGSFPVISRDFLSPNDGSFPAIAKIDDLWKFSMSMKYSRDNWDESLVSGKNSQKFFENIDS